MTRPLALALVAALAAPVLAQPSVPPALGVAALADAPRVLRAHTLDGTAVAVDGRLDEPAWAAAEVAGAFTQRDPLPGAPATEATEARVLVDGDALYVGMRLSDRQPVTARLGRRDTYLASDWATVSVGSLGDGRTAHAFAVNPAGVLFDYLLYDDVREDVSWDAVWEAAVTRDAGGWTAEFRIPFSQLRYSAAEGEQAWGLQFWRKLRRTGETSVWSPHRPTDDGTVSRFGTLAGLRGLRAPRRLELRPYAAAQVTRAPGDPADPFHTPTETAPRLGLDATVGLTGRLTLAATVNPDFGQVEADPAQVNLTAFELFVPERRPFFVEGADAFAFGQTRTFFRMGSTRLLYTRRIGRAPQRSAFAPPDAPGAVYTDAPDQTTILGAAKLSGRVGPFTVGLLDAVTAPEWGRYSVLGDGAPVEGRALVEPASNYLVGRARGRLGRTLVGGIVTDVRRATGDPALAAALPGGATVAGVDLEHRLGADWVVSGYAAGSHLTGTPEAIAAVQRAFPRLYTRPDADHLAFDPARTALSGATGELAVSKTGGRLLSSVVGSVTTPGFDANALGFQSRADVAWIGGVAIYVRNEPQGPFRSWSLGGFVGSQWNLGGDRQATVAGTNLSGELHSFWSGSVGVRVDGPATSDRLTRGGPLVATPAGLAVDATLRTDGRRPVIGALAGGVSRTAIGGGSATLNLTVTVQPRPNLSVEVGPGLVLADDPRQFVTGRADPALPFGRRTVVAALDQTTASLAARVDWTFSPALTLQLYARPYVSAGRFSRYGELAPGALRPAVYGEDGGHVEAGADGGLAVTPAAGDPFTLRPADFTARALQGNAVLRWEYRPGSALFAVWQQERNGGSDDGRIGGGDLPGLFGDPARNVFLVKWTYWVG